ncbi:hypothetical protein ACQX10_12200, partial [Corynebacterium diphtheriae]
VGLGDRVAACMPNTWQTLVGMLATTSLGAIWSCLQINDYPTLHQWSIDQRPDFWAAIVEFFDVQFRTPPSTVLVEGTQMPSAPVVSRRHPELCRAPAAPPR